MKPAKSVEERLARLETSHRRWKVTALLCMCLVVAGICSGAADDGILRGKGIEITSSDGKPVFSVSSGPAGGSVIVRRAHGLAAAEILGEDAGGKILIMNQHEKPVVEIYHWAGRLAGEIMIYQQPMEKDQPARIRATLPSQWIDTQRSNESLRGRGMPAGGDR